MQEEQRGAAPGREFADLLEYLKTSRGFDFSGYKLSSLMRRVQKRMQVIGAAEYGDYLDYLEVHPDEFFPLFNTVLINVTSFFRDPASWEVVAEQVLPRILGDKEPQQAVRCWSAGCASGEEAYTLAILLAEAMGEQEFRSRVKIYATDLDEEALAQARQGSYTAEQLEAVRPELVSRYFEPVGERYVFRHEMRRSLIFGRHDLVQDAAISRLDLLVCRNTLMYFNSDAQAKILARFHFALNRNGYLFLGKAETLLSNNLSFRPLDLKARLFQRTASSSLRDRMLAITPAMSSGDLTSAGRHSRIREAAFEGSPVAQLVVDRRGFLVLASDQARQLCSLAQSDLGRPFQDLEISYRPVELRSQIEQVFASRQGKTLKEVQWPVADGEMRAFMVQVAPLFGDSGELLGTSVSFVDLTLPRLLQAELERANQALETAYEELQSANEELETTNEELQSTVEELETTNEELQSANEELETMNEELQSTNEELRSINDQLHQRSEELNLSNVHLHSILRSLRAAVVVLNPLLEVEVWSDKAQELWGLRGAEVVGQPFLGLDIGLPVASLAKPIEESLNGSPASREVELDGVNRRGRPVRCRITSSRLGEAGGEAPAGVILLMEEIEPRSAAGP